ncbi:MAG: hypothetical protein F6K19_33580 [Cyanothece sp. SIO1E1]|nr:hypothetical protein [Cyanothece sp. SIO1E1]
MVRFLVAIVGGWLCWGFLALSAQAAPCESELTDLETNLITSQQGDVIVIGRPLMTRYVVAVPRRSDNTLDAVRQCVPDAFITRSRFGPYVYAGAFPNRNRAESLSALLRSEGLDARVIFVRARRQRDSEQTNSEQAN